MLANAIIVPTLPVSDIERAKKFYGETLGLTLVSENPGGVTYDSGGCKILVYPSQFAGTNQATAAGWNVDDVAAEVEELKNKGVSFEQYDNLPDTTREGDVHSMADGQWKGAWFKDPDGNILSIGSGM